MRYRIHTKFPDNFAEAPSFEVDDAEAMEMGMTIQEWVSDCVLDELGDDYGRPLAVGTVITVERIG